MRWVSLLALITACDDPADHTETFDDPIPTGGADNDNDGYLLPDDCNDADAAVHPGADELCNSVDDDCNGIVDDDPVDGFAGFVDADADGFGYAADNLVTCEFGAPGWSVMPGDCDDTQALIYPGAPEVCDGIDNDCDFRVDDAVWIGTQSYEGLAAAVAGSLAGDEITVCAAVTQVSGILIDRDLTIRSQSGDPATTLLDGSRASPASLFVVDGGDLTLDGLTLTGGTGTMSILNEDFPTLEESDGYAGGAVNALNGLGGAVTVHNCVFAGNTAHGGGAIAARTLTITDSTFVANEALIIEPVYLGLGGALFVGRDGSLHIERSVFDGNVGRDGGALRSASPTVLIEVEALNNVASNQGGFASIATQREPTPIAAITLDIIAGDIYDNVAGGWGGGLDTNTVVATIDASTTFTNNHAAGGGGARIHLGFSPLDSIWDGGTFIGNAAAEDGGGGVLISTEGGNTSNAVVSGIVVQDNTALGEVGGGVRMARTRFGPDSAAGTLTLRDSVVTGNEALAGGGIGFWGSAQPDALDFVIERVEIRDNIATDGGGIHLDGCIVSLTEVVLADNEAVEGGGAWIDPSSTLEVMSSEVSGNVPTDVWFADGGLTTDLADMNATATCVGADSVCF